MISSLSLNNFRSYNKINLNLSKNINVFIGDNAQGKTNLLEAIYYISNIRSHRTRNDKDLININQDYSRIILNINRNDKLEKLLCVIHQDGKYFSINNNVVSKSSDMLGRINTILFFPNETKIFTDSPSVRRSFFDVEIGKVSTNYTSNYQTFNSILKDRNKLLKENVIDNVLLDIITKKLIESQLVIIKEREYLSNFINENIAKHLNKLSIEQLHVKMNYKSTVKGLNKEELQLLYKKNIERDKFNKITNEGIHRDDFEFSTNEIEISKFLSQGQTRLVLLAVKFVLIDYIVIKTKRNPILLLDDVLSELDVEHQKNLINHIPKGVQTIITTTKQHQIFNNYNIKKFIIKNSQITNEEGLNGR